jgi:hypothetical protein
MTIYIGMVGAGTVILEHDQILAVNPHNPPPGIIARGAPDRNKSASSPVVSDVSGHRDVLEDFIHAVEQDRTPLCDGREGRRSVASFRFTVTRLLPLETEPGSPSSFATT